MLIIGHRGAAGLAVENTVSSFKKAQDLGVDMIETDLRLNKDDIVLAHDPVRKYKRKLTGLNELLEISRIPLNLEIKEKGFEEILLRKIKKFSHKILISSFQIGILKKIRALDESQQLGYIIGPKMHRFLPIVNKFVKKYQIYSVHAHFSLINSKNLKILEKTNAKIYAWTIDDPKEFLRLKNLKIDGVFTNRPDIIKK